MSFSFRSTCSLLLSTVSIHLLAQAGSLDPSFGNEGLVTLDLQGTDAFTASGMTLAPDGSFYVCGTASVAGVKQFALAHVLEGGAPDPDFGGTGYVLADVSDLEDEAFGITMVPEGRILVVGTSSEFWTNTSWITIAAFKPSGLLETTFGDGTGIVHTQLEEGWKASGRAIAMDDDGTFVVGGYADTLNGDRQALVARYEFDGSLHLAFGELGMGRFGQGHVGPGYFRESINSILITPDGSIVAAGDCDTPSSQYRAFKMRLNADGSAAPFTAGTFSWVAGPSRGNGIARQSDGHYVLVGQADLGGAVMAYHRCDEGGEEDNNDIVWFLDPGPRNSYGYAVAVDADDKALLAGAVNAGSGGRAFGLTRMQPGCENDTDFGTGGQVITPVGDQGWAEARAIAVQPDGKILLAGHARMDGRDVLAIARYRSEGSVGTNDATAANEAIDLFPNPAHDVVLVGYTQHSAEAVSVELVNAMGQVIARPSLEGTRGAGAQRGAITLPQGLSMGAYFLRLNDAGTVRTARLIVQ